MIGPSSSHTAGACRIALWARKIAGHQVCEVRFTLFGSFAKTWKGHGTDYALIAGILGFEVDDPQIRQAYTLAKKAGLQFSFIEAPDVVVDHPNTVQIDMINQDQARISVVGESIGGGYAKITRINGVAVKFNGRLNSMLVCHQDQPGLLAHIAQCCADRQINIAFLNLFRSDKAKAAYTLVETDDVISQDLLNALMAHDLISRVILLENQVSSSEAQIDASITAEYCFSNTQDIERLCARHQVDFATIMIRREQYLSGRSETAILEQMKSLWEVMKRSVCDPLLETRKTMGGLIGGEGRMVLAQAQDQALLGMGVKAMAYALAVLEHNAAMGLIVAAPTAGASGVLPGCLLAFQEEYHVSDDEIVRALFVAAGIAFLIQLGFSLSGAAGGCQAEVGAAAAMSGAAVTALCKGALSQIFNAATMSLMNLLGLVCDPIGGLVEMPCQIRNANGATTALSAAQMALAGVDCILPLDEMIEVSKRVGQSIPPSLKETAMGGTAVAPSAQVCFGCHRH